MMSKRRPEGSAEEASAASRLSADWSSSPVIFLGLPGSGVIWIGNPYPTAVIPAKAGIQRMDNAPLKVCGVDSRRLTGMTAALPWLGHANIIPFPGRRIHTDKNRRDVCATRR